MAGYQAPELAVDHQRDHQRAAHAHVFQILHMNGRYAAQKAQRHIQMLAGDRRKGWGQGHWRVFDVAQHPDPVSLVQPAGDLRDIGSRVAIAKKRLPASGSFASEKHFAMALVVEAIHHDPVIASQRLENVGGFVTNFAQRRGGDDGFDGFFQMVG